jgi:hypothetical protein
MPPGSHYINKKKQNWWWSMKRVVVGLCIVVLLFSGCIGQTAHRSYTNTVYGFSLDPPVGWNTTENVSANITVRFNPENISNVSLDVGTPFSLGEGLALSTFADQVEENLSKSGQNYTMVYRDWLSIPNVKAYVIAYSYEHNGMIQRAKQVAILKTRTVYLVTFSAPSTLYIKYLTAVDQSIDTFT